MKKMPTDTLYVMADGEISQFAVTPDGLQFYWYETELDAQADILPSEYRRVVTTQKQFERERGW